MGFFDKIEDITHTSAVSNNLSIEEAMKYLLRVSIKINTFNRDVLNNEYIEYVLTSRTLRLVCAPDHRLECVKMPSLLRRRNSYRHLVQRFSTVLHKPFAGVSTD